MHCCPLLLPNSCYFSTPIICHFSFVFTDEMTIFGDDKKYRKYTNHFRPKNKTPENTKKSLFSATKNKNEAKIGQSLIYVYIHTHAVSQKKVWGLALQQLNGLAGESISHIVQKQQVDEVEIENMLLKRNTLAIIFAQIYYNSPMSDFSAAHRPISDVSFVETRDIFYISFPSVLQKQQLREVGNESTFLKQHTSRMFLPKVIKIR